MNRMNTVLVIDDDEDVRDAISYVLKRAGHQVTEAEDGREALDRITADGLPSLILLDMNMPIMNGWEFARQLRARDLWHVPVLVITAALDAERSASEIGAAGFISKPFELDALVDAVEKRLAPAETSAAK